MKGVENILNQLNIEKNASGRRKESLADEKWHHIALEQIFVSHISRAQEVN